MPDIETASSHMNTVSDAEIIERGWETVARGDWDELIKDYTDDMNFVMPGQNDLLEVKVALGEMLDSLGSALPLGFNMTSIRQIGENDEVVSLIDWTSDKFPQGSQLAVLFKLSNSKIYEERWFIDTEQWNAAF